MLGHRDDHGRRVASHHTGEDGGVNDVQVVSAVDLEVQVNDGGTAGAAIVGAHLVGTEPMVGATAVGADGILLCMLARRS